MNGSFVHETSFVVDSLTLVSHGEVVRFSIAEYVEQRLVACWILEFAAIVKTKESKDTIAKQLDVFKLQLRRLYVFVRV